MRFDSSIQIKVKDAYAARHEPEAQRLLAQAYWAFLITSFVAAVIVVIAFGVWEFFRMPVVDESLSGVRPQTAFTKAQLQELLEKFDMRADRFQERLTAPVVARDPS
ncbi:hypothetical protein JNK62_02060 [bacterium]|nr:hypothetical protein [bacterium]